jgi:hypothetical protein
MMKILILLMMNKITMIRIIKMIMRKAKMINTRQILSNRILMMMVLLLFPTIKEKSFDLLLNI